MTLPPLSHVPESPDPSGLHDEACEYVLGTLSGVKRRAIEQRLPHDAALQAAIDAWEARLLPLTGLVDPVTPSLRLWQRIERSLQASQAVKQAPVPVPKPSSDDGRRQRWPNWNNLVFWRGLSAAASAIAAVLAVLLVLRNETPHPTTRFMVVLVAPQDKAPGWVIEAGMSRQLSLIPLGNLNVPRDKVLQFWTKADGWSGPVSLGLVAPGRTLQVALDKLPPLQANQLFELTLEPAAGSPIGKPTGPIQFIGRAVKVL